MYEFIVIIIITYVAIRVIKALFSIYTSRKMLLFGYFVFIVCAAGFGYYIVPRVELDLFRHFKYNVGRYIYWKTDPYLYARENGLFIWEYICWFVGRVLKNVHFLPVIFVGMTLLANWNLIRVFTRKYVLQSNEFFLYLSVLFACTNFNDLYSNLRNTCAFSFVALGTTYMLLERTKRNSYIKGCALFIAAIMIHKSAVVPIALFLLHILTRKTNIKMYWLYVWSIICPILANILSGIGVTFISSYARTINKYLVYTVIDYRLAIVLLIMAIANMICLGGMTFEQSDEELREVLRYLRILHMATIGAFMLKDLFSRMFYMIGFMYVFVIVLMIKSKREKMGTLYYSLTLILSYAAIAYNYVHLSTHIDIMG